MLHRHASLVTQHVAVKVPAKGGNEPVTEDGRPLTLPGCVQPMGVAGLLAQLLLMPPPARCIELGAMSLPCAE